MFRSLGGHNVNFPLESVREIVTEMIVITEIWTKAADIQPFSPWISFPS